MCYLWIDSNLFSFMRSLDWMWPLSAWSPDYCEGTYQSDILESARLVIPGAAWCVCVCVCVYVYVCMCMCVSNCVFVAVETISGGCWPILSSQLLWRDYCVCRVTNGLRFPLRLQTSDHFFKVCVYLHACVHARVCCAPLEAHILMLYHKKGIIMCSLAPWLTDQNWVKQWG